uniref:Proline-rich protein 35-like n=1 Tax=Sinocyclocheilus rhinocerous TaxID=307959 RepID=A0A673G3F7_9TELE
MSKEDCKVGCKHKERKPKKPHYIPRPWGKPYNYKCFQCPFTCMEKSHLYNHMKYSLCKNSLSLLIESDWPYKKEQLRLQQGGTNASTVMSPESAEMCSRGSKRSKLSKTCLSGPAALLSEQWRILSNQTSGAKPKSDPVASSLPCYPPPASTGQIECPETPGFNLSLLGVGYPLAPGLLSYLNPALSLPASTANTSAPLPFLASTHTQRHSEHPLLPPHLYYPFLCEHTFGATPSSTSSETGKLIKPPTASLPPPSYPPKLNLWKVPALRTTSSPADGVDEWYLDRIKRCFHSPRSDVSSPPHMSEQLEARQRGMERDVDPAAALLQDFSTLLQEYQNTEQRAASLPEQCHLWAHLGKIRSELSHIQQALEHTARSNEGPLDLSIKKDPVGITNVAGDILGQTKDTGDENCSETEDDEEEEDGKYHRDAVERGSGAKERQKCSLDALMKLNPSQLPVVKTEVLSDGGLAIRPGTAEALWHSRTTKCEADSSVLLCSKTPNRPPSIQHLDTLCPTSPLTTTDTMV